MKLGKGTITLRSCQQHISCRTSFWNPQPELLLPAPGGHGWSSGLWQWFRPGPNQKFLTQLLIQKIHYFIFFSENFSHCYFSFRDFELSNLFVDVVRWAQTIIFSLKLLTHISYKLLVVFFSSNEVFPVSFSVSNRKMPQNTDLFP